MQKKLYTILLLIITIMISSVGCSFVPGGDSEKPVQLTYPDVNTLSWYENGKGASAEETNRTLKTICDKLITDSVLSKTSGFFIKEDQLIADISETNPEHDLVLSYNETENSYKLAIDSNCWFIEGFSYTTTGIDLASYNEANLHAMLSAISASPDDIYNAIDSIFYSSFYISDTDWTPIGDCYMIDCGPEGNAWVFKIKTELE